MLAAGGVGMDFLLAVGAHPTVVETSALQPGTTMLADDRLREDVFLAEGTLGRVLLLTRHLTPPSTCQERYS